MAVERVCLITPKKAEELRAETSHLLKCGCPLNLAFPGKRLGL